MTSEKPSQSISVRELFRQPSVKTETRQRLSSWKHANHVTTYESRSSMPLHWLAWINDTEHQGDKAPWIEHGFIQKATMFTHAALEQAGWLAHGADELDACQRLQRKNPKRLTPLP